MSKDALLSELIALIRERLMDAQEVIEYQRKRGLRTTKYETIRDTLLELNAVIAKYGC